MSYDLRWTETMRGQLVVGADVFGGSSATTGGIDVEFTVRGTIADLDRFIDDDKHSVVLEGHVSSELVGGRRPIDCGELQLFRPTTTTAVTELAYLLEFSDADGARFKLYAVKTVRDDRGFDLWRDTSTVDAVLRNVSAPHHRDLEATERGTTAVARGRLRISVLGFLVLFLTMRAGGNDKRAGVGLPRRMVRSVVLRARFASWFLRRLAGAYGNPFSVNSAAIQVTDRRVGRRVELEFKPRSRVKWADPRVLWRTFGRLRFATNLGASIDARQMQPDDAAPFQRFARFDEVWLDFVADTGDGFAATYSVMYTVSRPKLSIRDEVTTRGTALVLGGDLVYPTPTRDDYRERLLNPLRAALPDDGTKRDVVLAIPGNHDWYDNLQSFMHTFMSPGREIGARRTVQRHSYFAIKLPHGWWMLGVDIALDQRVDDKQVRFLRGVAKQIGEHDNVVLVVAKPAWLEPEGSSAAKNLEFIECDILESKSLRLVLSGDVHHYARYGSAAAGPARITCGGGGAYTAGTHHLPGALDACWSHRDGTGPAPLKHRYPSKPDSLRMRRGVLLTLLGRFAFVATLGAVNLLLVALLLGEDANAASSTIGQLRDASLAEAPNVVWRGLLGNPVALAIWAAVAVAVLALALSGRRRAGWAAAFVAGVLHAAAQLSVVVVVLWSLMRVESPSALSALVVGAGSLVAGYLSAFVVGVYLFVTDWFGLHPDIVFAVQSRTEFKSFVRLHIDDKGNLDLFVFGIPEIVAMWHKNEIPEPAAVAAAGVIWRPVLVPTAANQPRHEDDEPPPYVELIERLTFPPN